MRLASTLRAPTRSPLMQVTKVAVATVGAWIVVELLLPGELPIFATIAALLVVQPSVNQTLGKAIERSIGVIVGVLVAYAIGVLFPGSAWIVLLAIVVAIFLSWALKLTPGTANQVPISAMLVLSIGARTPNYAFDRVIETIIGAVIGIIVNIAIVPPVLLAPAHQSVLRLANEIAATLDRLSVALVSAQSPAQLEELLITARLLRPMQAKADAALKQGAESLQLNPRRSRHREVLEEDAQLLTRLTPLITRVLGMTRALRDHYDDDLRAEPDVQAISSELSRAAHDLRLIARSSAASEASPAAPGVPEFEPEPEPPALTAPLSIAVPKSRHWVLIGSLLEDLRRVREEILGD